MSAWVTAAPSLWPWWLLIRDGNRTEPEPKTPNSNPIFGLSEPNRTERTQRDQLTEPNRTVRLFEPNRTEPELYGKCSIPMAVKNSRIWIMTHPFIKLMIFLSVCVLLKHFNCERPPDSRTKCKIHVYCRAILCEWYTKTEQIEPELQFQSNRTEPNLDKTQIEPWPWPNRTETVSGFDSHHYFW